MFCRRQAGVSVMLKDFTLGQYYAADSVIHRMDPRFKLVEMIAFIVFIFLASDFYALFLITAAVFAVLFMSRVPVKMYLRNLKMILPIVIFTALLNALYVTDGTLLWSFWIFRISTGGLLRAGFMSLRILLLILISAALTYTTTPTALTDAIESLLSPLKWIGLGEAVHTLAMMMTIALRFIPTLTDETDKIISAQKARGADMENGGIFKRLKALLPILIPLLISSIRRANELADAMDCRCYSGGKGRTRMKKLRAAGRDYVAVLILAVLLAAIIALRFC